MYTKEALDLSSKLLESNPEHYTGWNYRKLAVQHLLETAPNSDSDSIQPILDEELRLVENALKKNLIVARDLSYTINATLVVK